MIRLIFALIALLFTLPIIAQLGGESTYQFLNLVASPRQAALGGKVITNFDGDVTDGLYNPAAINADMHNQLAVNYSSYLAGISYGTAAYAYTWDRHIQTFHFGVSYINYGTFDGFDVNGQSTGTFTGNEVALSFGYNYNIPFTDIYLGINGKLISSLLEQYNSLGGAVDFGAMYINEKLNLNVALTVRNIGTQFTTFNEANEPLPLEVNFGISQLLQNLPLRWHLTFDNLQQWPIGVANPARSQTDLNGNQIPEEVSFFNQLLRHTIIGAELFPNRGFNIRMGYNFRRSEELRIENQRNFSGLSFGVGITLNKLKFNYSHARYAAAGNTNFFGIQINLQ